MDLSISTISADSSGSYVFVLLYIDVTARCFRYFLTCSGDRFSSGR